ncbi:uncharacterized protein LOC143376050 isoform X2 [Andrena cerasifolii]|uniref:uncharacterized protein LOC143376050 isoform X2 n=1 Tax=Andrena cerasifolii TaxID=2819439 RepID=UPI004037FFDB
MLPKTIFLLLFLGAVAQFSISEHRNRNGSAVPPGSVREDSNSFVLVNPNQVHRLEKTIRSFISKIAEPVKGPIILRSTAATKKDLQLTIRAICDSMRNTLMQFAKDCELTTTVRRYKQDPSNAPASEDWFSETVLQGAYMFRDLSNMINEIHDEIDLRFDQRNASSQRNKQVARKADGFQFLGVVYDAADFGERLSQCLVRMAGRSKHKRSFNLNQAVLNLTKYPPNVALKIFRSNISSTPLNTSSRGARKSWHAFLCLSMIKEEGIRYNDCIRDLQHLDTCLHSLKQRSSQRSNIAAEPWTKAIQRLSDCKIQKDNQGKVLVSCKPDSRTQGNVKQKMRYMFQRILGKQLPKRSPLHRAANDLGDALSKSDWGQKLVHEVCQYFTIYEDGSRKLQRLSALAAKDKRAMARYRKLSRDLRVYKKGIFLRTFGAMKKMHRSAVEFEKFLVKGIKVILNETWQSHVRIFTCMMDWMNKLLELHIGVDSSGDEQQSSDSNTELAESGANENIENSNDDEDYGKIMKEADGSINNLIASMNHVTRYRGAKDGSMLACLANNLLLVTMFMETLGFVSTLFCFRQPTNNEQNLGGFDRIRNRLGRSLFPWNDQEDIDAILDDYLYLGVDANLTTLIRDDSD